MIREVKASVKSRNLVINIGVASMSSAILFQFICDIRAIFVVGPRNFCPAIAQFFFNLFVTSVQFLLVSCAIFVQRPGIVWQLFADCKLAVQHPCILVSICWKDLCDLLMGRAIYVQRPLYVF